MTRLKTILIWKLGVPPCVKIQFCPPYWSLPSTWLPIFLKHSWWLWLEQTWHESQSVQIQNSLDKVIFKWIYIILRILSYILNYLLDCWKAFMFLLQMVQLLFLQQWKQVNLHLTFIQRRHQSLRQLQLKVHFKGLGGPRPNFSIKKIR